MEITTIKLTKKTKGRLEKLKLHKKESYEEVLQKILNILNTCRVNPHKAKEILLEIDNIRKKLSSSKNAL